MTGELALAPYAATTTPTPPPVPITDPKRRRARKAKIVAAPAPAPAPVTTPKRKRTPANQDATTARASVLRRNYRENWRMAEAAFARGEKNIAA